MEFDGNEWHQTTLHNMHFVPEMTHTNLFSLGAAMDRGYTAKKTSSVIELSDENGQVTLVGKSSKGSLWTVQLKEIPKAQAYSARADMLTWQKRLGHPSQEKLKRIEKEAFVLGFNLTGESEKLECKECPIDRMTRLPWKTVDKKKGKVGKHLAADLCGPMQAASLGGAKYKRSTGSCSTNRQTHQNV
jgi:hypothetical protein